MKPDVLPFLKDSDKWVSDTIFLPKCVSENWASDALLLPKRASDKWASAVIAPRENDDVGSPIVGHEFRREEVVGSPLVANARRQKQGVGNPLVGPPKKHGKTSGFISDGVPVVLFRIPIDMRARAFVRCGHRVGCGVGDKVSVVSDNCSSFSCFLAIAQLASS